MNWLEEGHITNRCWFLEDVRDNFFYIFRHHNGALSYFHMWDEVKKSHMVVGKIDWDVFKKRFWDKEKFSTFEDFLAYTYRKGKGRNKLTVDTQ